MNCELLNNKLYKKTLLHMTLWVFIIFSLYSIVLKTLYTNSISNAAFMIPIFVDLIPHITDMSEIIGILIAYAYITYSFYKFDNKKANSFVGTFIGLTVYKYLATIAVTYLPVLITRANSGKSFSVDDILIELLLTVLVPLVLEVVQLLIVVLFTKHLIKTAFDFIKEKKALEGKLPGYHFDEHSVFFPFVKLFNTQNPLQKIALWQGIVIMASKIIQIIILDISIGWPQSLLDLLWMIFTYLSFVVLGFVSYLIIIFVLIGLNSKEIK